MRSLIGKFSALIMRRKMRKDKGMRLKNKFLKKGDMVIKKSLVQLFYNRMILPQNLHSQTFLFTLSFLHPRPFAQLGSPRIAFSHLVNGRWCRRLSHFYHD